VLGVKNKNALASIKENVDSYVGKRVKLKTNLGRKKVLERVGIVEKTYPHIFVVKVNDEKNNNTQRLSFSYSDILMETVELTLVN
jgi:uncharacterized protein Veg